MLIENGFTVAAPPERLWAHLLDVERVVPCMPGAELTEAIDERTWRGRLLMKLGPVSLSFAGTVEMRERDDEAHRLVLLAKGMEQNGKGAANAVVTSWLEPGEDGTTVRTSADIQLTGSVAQVSRGLLPDVSRKLTEQFASRLQESMAAAEEPSPPEAPPAAEPIGGIRLALWALWRWIRRLFGGGPRS